MSIIYGTTGSDEDQKTKVEWVAEIKSEQHHMNHNEFNGTDFTPEDYFDHLHYAGYFVEVE